MKISPHSTFFRLGPEPSVPSGPGVAIPDVQVVEKTRHCPLYKVFVHNDDITPMFLVVDVLRNIFCLGARRAVAVMAEAHGSGVAFVVALPLEQAEFRVEQAHSIARGRGYPLTFTYEPE